ncbi:manganese efflux pump MntP family protein [Oscillatoria sp. FACHB-1406]|uniref:manganese efflux pump MntP n=1 Tax=Oscillatoria sp. FACHB-1406 TaxID=2692846 RepID=UPI0016892940|nr:manganese efflux pump MntP family protein [Oscillatoria sp. FACHB-1406]MBD2579390.1 manganese efflux pump [Oscillatoria sp. FACHB-1406]
MYDFITPILLGIGLSADAFAVSLSSGLAIKHLTLNKILKIALFFGGFQAIMPLIGWALGYGFRGLIADIDHWIAFGLLLAIGGKMIREAFQEEEKDKKFNPLDTYTLLTLSIATSIDALAAGISLAVVKTPVLMAASIIGTITFFLSGFGVAIGHRFGNFCRDKVEICGGVVLIAIGFKILIEHLTQ